MARTTATNFTGGLQFPYATAATDLFKKEDVQTLAQAVDQHDHSSGKGLALSAGSIPTGSITSAMIADGTIVAGDIADGAITSAKILDGTIATGDHAAASITNALLASDTARLNLLTNGGFEIWQRGNGPFTGTGTYSADRWASVLAGSDTLSTSRDTSNVDNSLAAAALTFTLGTGGGASRLEQSVARTSDGLEQFKSRTVTFSIRVRTSTASAARAYVSNDGGTTRTSSSFHTGSGNYETLSVTLSLGAATDVRVGVLLAASSTVYLDNAMLVVGSQAADYAPLHPADDLARCLRYYELILGTAGNYFGQGAVFSTTIFYSTIPLLAQKAVAPTITFSAPANFSVQSGAGAQTAVSAITTLGTVSAGRMVGVNATTAGATQGGGHLMVAAGQSASIVVEANP